MNNTYYKIVFQPKDTSLFNHRRRFGVGVKSLQNYIGEANKETVIKTVKKKEVSVTENKIRMKFRKWGIIDIYIY